MGESLFEEHKHTSVVSAPSSQVPQMLKAEDIIVQEPWLYVKLQELLVSILCFCYVSE